MKGSVAYVQRMHLVTQQTRTCKKENSIIREIKHHVYNKRQNRVCVSLKKWVHRYTDKNGAK